MDKNKYWFFGSKLNTALLSILIILMIIALRFMYHNKATYLPAINEKEVSSSMMEGNKEDLASFSIKPNQEVSGLIKSTGTISGGYFFEGSMPIQILDENKNKTNYGPEHANSTTDWMTAGPVSFSVDFDFTKIPKGKYYIKIIQDDPSGGESGKVLHYVLIPITVK